jgi:putative membrane protein
VTALADVLVALVAALHAYFLVLEMFLWDRPQGRKAFGLDHEFATSTKAMAANQGLYNGFLAAGLVWGLLAGGDLRVPVLTFFLACVVVAGVFGAATVSRRILLVQALPAAVALIAVLVAR